MTQTLERHGGQECRIGLLSRIDYPSDGFRQALLELAAEEFRRENLHFIILAGGLVYERAVKAKLRDLKKKHRELSKRLKELTKEGAPPRSPEMRKLNRDLAKIERRQAELEPENMAAFLAKTLPRFKNSSDKPVKIYVVPSPAYDGEIGEHVARLLAAKRPKDIIVYRPGSDRLTITQAERVLEVLVPEKTAWMRGDYYSTPVERVIKDKLKQTSEKHPDLLVVGCFGSSITKPQGEIEIAYASVPVLHRLEETRTAENQIGVRVMVVQKDRLNPVLRTYNFKDHVSHERQCIGMPRRINARQKRCIELMKERGRMSTGQLAHATGIKRATMEKDLRNLVPKDGRTRKTWPGLHYDKEGHRWDFNLGWVQKQLRYQPMPETAHTDSIVAYGCLHAGSVNTDYEHFLGTVPQVILDKDASILVGAGDFVEGLAHNLILKGEIYGGLIVTQQEILAGEILAKVNMDVFKVRFPQAFEAFAKANRNKRPNEEQLRKLVWDSLLQNVVIPGNHDLWVQHGGHRPLVIMKSTMQRRMSDEIEQILSKMGLCANHIGTLVDDRIVEPKFGRYQLPSGLQMTVLHPHMARAKTTSLRPQSMLGSARDSQVVIGANFHVGEHIDVWDGQLGQRTCLQVGTLKHRTDFEDNKLKIVDQGYGFLRVESAGGRIRRTEATFYSSEKQKMVCLDPDKPFNDLLKQLGLK